MTGELTPSTTLLPGPDRGAYPYGNSVMVRGKNESLLIDPSLVFSDGSRSAPEVDAILLSHVHEDHVAGLAAFSDRPVHVHRDDHIGLESLEGLLEIYGMPADIESVWAGEILEQFHYVPRPDAVTFEDNQVWDLGGGTTVRAVHLPGHTRGHSGFLVEPDGVFYLGDIDLTGFGPYYGDAWSSLADWGPSLRRCREIEARWFATFHHKGTIDGRDAFIALLDDYEAVIAGRERALLEFLAEPHSMADIVEHRFVYRPGVELLWIDYVEERSMAQHLERLLADDTVHEIEPGLYRRAG